MKIGGVEFSDQKQYEAVKNSVESAMIEGFTPTKQDVRQIKSILDDKMTIDELIATHKNRDRSFTKI